ncbi:hypothetical protein [Nodosilinea sp. P-1105]|uniref:hypothetical protein n=1 Tax=Nodosilinea sp. P-1105 TaxID=2546229 RepID=UPI00146E9412|nr:hypothetical protein [Nodosilinea sp. P-1105]
MVPQLPNLTAPPGYRPQANDTSLEVDLLDFYLLRQRTPTERLRMAAALMQTARQWSLDCLGRQFAHLPPPAFARKLAEVWLQDDCPAHYIPTGSKMTWIQDTTALVAQLHQIFLTVQVPYYVTGGVAAITYGEPRTTRDLDMVISVSRDALGPLAAALEAAGFYVPGVEDVAMGRMHTLQVTQVATISRADFVLADTSEYEQLKFARRRLIPLPHGPEVYVAAPEDIVVSKLRWGQTSQSEKQWRDVLGILKTQQDDLDYDYMHVWAASFNLSQQLEQAILAAGVRPIADQQWAMAIYPVVIRAFAIAHSRGRTSRPSPTQEIADGHHYTLVKSSTAQTLTIMSKLDDRDIAQFALSGTVLSASPSGQDRRQWQAIAQRVAAS